MVKSLRPLRDALLELVETQIDETQTGCGASETATVGLTDAVIAGLLAIAVIDGKVVFFECSECQKWRKVGLKSLKEKVEGMGKNGKKRN